MIVDGIAIFQDAVDGLDERYEFIEVGSEFLRIGDVEENVELGLLRKAAPAKQLGEHQTHTLLSGWALTIYLLGYS